VTNRPPQSSLRLRSASVDYGTLVEVTPETSGWDYVGFAAMRLPPGGRLELPATRFAETCLVVLSGRCHIDTRQASWRNVGSRSSVFDGPPHALYIPPGIDCHIEAATMLNVGVCTAPADIGAPLRLLTPDDMHQETRGDGTEQREICNILMEGQQADSLLVTEVVTPAGHWSSYPPHKHDSDDLPHEAYLEETYYHRMRDNRCFGFQRVYTDDRSLDEGIAIEDGDLVLVPRGYHPVAASPASDLYYLNVMAGPTRAWRVRVDPAFSPGELAR
jgi:5-deoxy-glucuronate isomerase